MTRRLIFGSIIFTILFLGFTVSAPESYASYGNVKSVQRGLVGNQLANFVHVTIAAVNPSKTIVFCHAGLGANSAGGI